MPTFDIVARYSTSAEAIDRDIVSIRETIEGAGWSRSPGGGSLFDSQGNPVAQLVYKDSSGNVVAIEQNFRMSKADGTKEQAQEIVTRAVRTTTRLGRLQNLAVRIAEDVGSAVTSAVPKVKREVRILQFLVGGGIVLGLLIYLKSAAGAVKGALTFSGLGGENEWTSKDDGITEAFWAKERRCEAIVVRRQDNLYTWAANRLDHRKASKGNRGSADAAKVAAEEWCERHGVKPRRRR